ncbi:uncharacterized protein LOC142531298 [Primulina tabacum]|uniref:uncharacterized protein LOC142531298 n=1 Tax=Primulina tabacum TaxID=48773 RepID=UPI003F5A9A22
MNQRAFGRLCYLLTNLGGLGDSRYVRVEEKVAMFLSILAHHKKNRVAGHDYIRSGQTVSAHFLDVLKALLKLHPLLLVKPSPVDDDCRNEAWRCFKGCLGALDGTLIGVHVPCRDKARYRNRKGTIAVNVLVVCDRNMNFIYALTGWEGSAADARVLRDALNRDDSFRVPREAEKQLKQLYMDSGASSASVVVRSKKQDKTRRSWNAREEEVLIQALKDVITKGWKSENEFKAGYLNLLENAMQESIPGNSLRGNPHINSKIHVWKKTYSTLVTLLSKSGVGWNDCNNTIDVTDETWETIVKTDPTLRSMRHKQWTHYHDWCEIFGNDRATGERATNFENALHEVLNIDNELRTDAWIAETLAFDTVDAAEDSKSENNTPSSKPKECVTSKIKKRKKATDDEQSMLKPSKTSPT